MVGLIVVMNNVGGRWFQAVAPGVGPDPHLDVRRPAWHLVYLAGFVVALGVVALVRHGASRRVAVAGVVAVALLASGGWFQTRPASTARLAAMADFVQRPAAHQACELRGDVRYCAYSPYAGWFPLWDRPVRGVLTRLPAEVRARGLEVRQRIPRRDYPKIPADVRARLSPAQAWPADDVVHPGVEWFVSVPPLPVPGLGGRSRTSQQSGAELTLAVQTGSWAVGLPPVVGWSTPPCHAGGQARAVVALWLAGQATPPAGRALRAAADRATHGGLGPALVRPAFSEDTGPLKGFRPEEGVAWQGPDVVAAVRLLDRPAQEVSAALAADWDRLTDPATPVADLFAAVGAPAPPANFARPEEPGRTCP